MSGLTPYADDMTKRIGDGLAPSRAPGAAAIGRVLRIQLTDFRNIAALDLTTSGRHVVLTGGNGGGKSAVLEALSLFAGGRGMAGAMPLDLARRGSNRAPPAWGVSAEIAELAGPVRIGAGLVYDKMGRARRVFRREGEAARGEEIAGHIRLIWQTPRLDHLFGDSRSSRLAHFDTSVARFEPTHGRSLLRYEKAQRERLAVLKDHGTEHAWLEGLEIQLAREGVAIAVRRLDLLSALAAELADSRLSANITALMGAQIALDGELETMLRFEPAAQVEGRFLATLRSSRARDSASGRMLNGAHRTAVSVVLSQTGIPAEQASTGEQKGILLSLLQAEARLLAERTGRAPVLLLDNVLAHLDRRARSCVLAAFAATSAQIFAAGLSPAEFEVLGTDVETIRLEDGRLNPASASAQH